MKPTPLAGRRIACLGIGGLVVITAASAASSPPRFRLTDLGVLPGGTQSAAMAISDTGVIVGRSTDDAASGYPLAVAWIDGAIVELTGLAVSGAVANAVNDAGQIVGITDEFSLNAFRWQDGALIELPAPNVCCAEATGINVHGHIVGRAAISGGGTPNEAAIWIDGGFSALPSLGFGYDTPFDINDEGVIVGTTYDGARYVAARWDDDGISALPSLGGFITEASAVNDAGNVVGYSTNLNGIPRAVRWTDRLLSELPGFSTKVSGAHAINDRGWTVGFSTPAVGPARAALWIDGELHDLATLVVNGPATLMEASGVNASGAIVGRGSFAGANRAFLLTPVAAEDLDGDGSVDGTDLGALLAAWGRCDDVPSCVADITGDGIVDGADLGALLAAWSAPSGR